MSGLLDRLGRTDLTSGLVSAEVDQWKLVASQSVRVLSAEGNDWAGLMGPMARDTIERAIRALPRRQARQLRAAVAPWDRMFWEKTLPEPGRGVGRPWWWRRRGV